MEPSISGLRGCTETYHTLLDFAAPPLSNEKQASRHEKIIGRARNFFMKLGGRGMGVAWAWRGCARELLVGRSPYLWRDPCSLLNARFLKIFAFGDIHIIKIHKTCCGTAGTMKNVDSKIF